MKWESGRFGIQFLRSSDGDALGNINYIESGLWQWQLGPRFNVSKEGYADSKEEAKVELLSHVFNYSQKNMMRFAKITEECQEMMKVQIGEKLR
jgi:hypothetical protein